MAPGRYDRSAPQCPHRTPCIDRYTWGLHSWGPEVERGDVNDPLEDGGVESDTVTVGSTPVDHR
jgi:hypothetical protein